MPVVSKNKPNKQIMGGKEKVRVACIQAPQIVFNKQKSIEIACQRIKEAGANGAQLVAFSETYIPVFPAYYSSAFDSNIDEWTLWNIGLQDNSIVIPSEDTDIIGAACRDAGVYCVMGVNELDDADGVRTFYNTQIFFGADGSILGRHRKIKPTYTERSYWGEGDGSDINVYKTPIGRIGGLICYEHHTIAIRAAQMLMGEEFHISNWPGTWQLKGGKMLNRNMNPLAAGCDGHIAAKEYAFQSGAFVLSVHGLLRPEDFEPEYKSLIDSKDMNFEWANGGSCIINPFGEFIAEPVLSEDTIIYGDCYANEIKAAKAFFDGLGHYSKPSVAQVVLNRENPTNLVIAKDEIVVPEYAKIRQISEEYEIKLQRLEALAAKLESK